MTLRKQPVVYLPHGGGPLPILGHHGHQHLISFLTQFGLNTPKPDAIVVVSAHWESHCVSVTSHPQPTLIYDYYGFPPEAYAVSYPVPGAPNLAQEISKALHLAGIESQLDCDRGIDHGVFIPLMLAFPKADVPCIQLSLKAGLHAEEHIAIGEVIRTLSLPQRNILILGSGFSFHNMAAFGHNDDNANHANEAFQSWLMSTCTSNDVNETKLRLIDWQSAPSARFCHPREEHLIPLHVCFGAASETPAKVIFDNEVIGKRVLGFAWR